MESEKKKKQREDAAQKIFYGKNHENKSLMGPLKSLGTLGKYPLFPPPPPFSVGLVTGPSLYNHSHQHANRLTFTLSVWPQIWYITMETRCSENRSICEIHDALIFLLTLLSATADCDPKVCWLLEHSLWSARDPAEDTRGGALEAAGYHCHAGRTWRTPWPCRQCRTFSLIQGLPWAGSELFGGSHLARWGK